MIYPYLSYNVEVWGTACDKYLTPLVVQQKRVIRTMCGAGKYDHTSALFYELGILKFEDIFKYHVSLRMFRCMSEGRFTCAHEVNTRNRTLAKPTFHRLSQTQRAFSHIGPKVWNSLPINLRSISSFRCFKKKLKIYLVSNYV